jgi:copper(I)-binding protein
MKRLLIPAALLTLTACNPTPAPEGPAVVTTTDALCRPTPNGRAMTGCYLTLTASRDDRLVAVANGMMSMAELPDGLPLPAGEAVALQPGGNHIMLMALKQPLAEGEMVSLTLTFEHAPPMGVRAVVGQPPAAGSRPAG